MAVIATAGHVDHGKSTLIQALTGRNPDRLEEEKRRGLTIDLGFAWMDLPGGRRISFVDVPGHRRFIGNMLTGVGPVDAVLFVVAANEGWKPQSEEHLAIVDLLSIDQGVVALTKVDLVSDQVLAERFAEVEMRLRGTSLESSSIIPLSPLANTGLAELIDKLGQLNLGLSERSSPRLWVDRAFTVPGAGTVVTGTLTGGQLRVGDAIELWPGDGPVRIRALHSNDRPVDSASPGSRVAINFAGSVDVGRGSLVAGAATLVPSTRWLAHLRPARYEAELHEKGAFLLHLGTLAVATKVRLLGEGYGIVEVEGGVPVVAGDRFILRETGRQRVTAGGVVLMPSPPRRGSLLDLGKELQQSLASGPDQIATTMLSQVGRMSAVELSSWSGGGRAAGVIIGDLALSVAEFDHLRAAAGDLVKQFQEEHPLEPGMGLGALATELSISPEVARHLVDRNEELQLAGSVVARTGVVPKEAVSDSRWLTTRDSLRGLAPPSIAETGLTAELLRALVRSGELIRVSDDFVYLPESIEQLLSVIRSFEAPFSVSDFRTRAGISRKYAVPVLEYTDREGITMRQGDLRTVRR